MPKQGRKPYPHQLGAALLTVVFILAILATFAVYTLEDENLAIKRLTNQREYEQSLQVAIGGEMLALKVLERDNVNQYDYLNEPWSTSPLAGVVEDGEFATLIEDESGKFNINNLRQLKTPPPPPTGLPATSNPPPAKCSPNQPNPTTAKPACNAWYELFYSLLLSQGVSPDFAEELADAVVDWVDDDNQPAGDIDYEDGYYQAYDTPYRTAGGPMISIAELPLLAGFNQLSSAELQGLMGLLTALPVGNDPTSPAVTKINVNTAPIELLQALYVAPPSNKSVWATVEGIQSSIGYQNLSDFIVALGNAGAQTHSYTNLGELLDIKSDYFKARSCARYGRISVALDSQMHRQVNQGRTEVTVFGRQRVYQTCGTNKVSNEDNNGEEENDVDEE